MHFSSWDAINTLTGENKLSDKPLDVAFHFVHSLMACIF